MKKILITAGCIIVVIFSAVAWFSQEPYIKAKQLELEEAQAELDLKKEENARLKEEEAMIGTDEFTEKVARSKLGFVKKGEIVFVDIEKQ